jgi:hypothetical protein
VLVFSRCGLAAAGWCKLQNNLTSPAMKKTMIVILLAALSGCYQNKAAKSDLEGKAMPSFNLLLKDSVTNLNTSAIPVGKPAVLVYIGTHCPYSRAEIQDIVDNMTELKDLHLYIFTADNFQAMKSFSAHYQLDKYPNVTIGRDTGNVFGKYISAMGVPYTAIYTKDKKLLKLFPGTIKASLIKETAME